MSAPPAETKNTGAASAAAAALPPQPLQWQSGTAVRASTCARGPARRRGPAAGTANAGSVSAFAAPAGTAETAPPNPCAPRAAAATAGSAGAYATNRLASSQTAAAAPGSGPEGKISMAPPRVHLQQRFARISKRKVPSRFLLPEWHADSRSIPERHDSAPATRPHGAVRGLDMIRTIHCTRPSSHAGGTSGTPRTPATWSI